MAQELPLAPVNSFFTNLLEGFASGIGFFIAAAVIGTIALGSYIAIVESEVSTETKKVPKTGSVIFN